MRKFVKQGKVWWEKYGEKVILAGTMIFALVLAFEAGMFKGMTREAKPMTIEVPAKAALSQPVETAAAAPTTPGAKTVTQAAAIPAQCAFVGSKNSTLYHLPTCAAAKRIKPENRVCFSDADDAAKRGYKPGCLT